VTNAVPAVDAWDDCSHPGSAPNLALALEALREIGRNVFLNLPLMTAVNAAKSCSKPLILFVGAPEEIRSPDPQIRSLPARPHYEL